MENRKNEYYPWILHIRNYLGNTFYLKLTIGQKRNKWISPLNSSYSNLSEYQISLQTNNFEFRDQIYPRIFWVEHGKRQFQILGPHWPKRVLLLVNGKSEYHHWNLHIQISLGNKFYFKQILSFVTKFAQKAYFGRKQKKEYCHSNMNSTPFKAPFDRGVYFCDFWPKIIF